MKQISIKIEHVKKIKPQIYLLSFKAPFIAKNAKAGQFLHIKVDNKITILRRPFSIHSIKGNLIYILLRIRGRGTKLLAQCKRGDNLDIIGPLGNGFDYSKSKKQETRKQIIVAGGIGVAPLVFLGKKLPNTKALVILGAKNRREVVCESGFRRMGHKVLIATEDGSRGFRGTAVDLLKKELKASSPKFLADIYVCGPKEMFFEIKKILKNYPKVKCQVSFEQFMGCGLGICCGCSIETKQGYKKVCKDGPVFNLKEI